MIRKLIDKMFIVEDDYSFAENELEVYLGLLDTAIYTADREQRIAALIRIRKMAFDYINNDNPLGYMLIADWNTLQKQTDNALVNYLRAANAGIPQAIKKIDDYKLTAESSAGSCILLAEAFFLNGNELEGIHYLKRCVELGCSSAESMLQLQSKGCMRRMTSFDKIKMYISDFRWRLSEGISLDYGELDELHQEKTVNFCYGFAIAKGALTTVNRDEHIVSISHSYMERVLVKVPNEEAPKKVSLLIRDWGDMKTAMCYLVDGIGAVIDYSKCRAELARVIFDTLGGLLFGLTGDINKISTNEFEYTPYMKEADGTETGVWNLLEHPKV